jgi:hypothetical protein
MTQAAIEPATVSVDDVRELTVDELNAIAGGVVARFTIGNDSWEIAATARAYEVRHYHFGP